MFHQLVTCALGCMALGQLDDVILLMIRGGLPEGFHLGILGMTGGFLFLLSASYGTMDGLVDGKARSDRKYRLAALAAPFMILGLLAASAVFCRTSIGITDVFLFLIMAASSYYNLKHLIMPDVDFGIIRCIRPYNLTALLLTLCMAFRQFSEAVGSLILYGIFSLLLSAAYLILIPVLERGSRKWTM